jgi:hypothetical protein
MTVELQLGPEVESRLRRKAAAGGQSLEAYLCAVVERESTPLGGDSPPATSSAENDEERPWRGVFVLPRLRRALFSPTLAFSTLDLPRRRPSPNMNWHRVSADDE